MKQYIKPIVLLFLILLTSCKSIKNTTKNKPSKNTVTLKKFPPKKPKKDAILPYEKVVTKKAKTDEGLFKIHQIDNKYLYEIPDSLFGRESF